MRTMAQSDPALSSSAAEIGAVRAERPGRSGSAGIGLRASPRLGEVGAGVYITPNCVRQLQGGTGTGGREVGRQSRRQFALLHHDGTRIAPVRVTDFFGLERDLWHASRRPVDMMAKALPADVVHTGHRCTGFERHGEVARVSLQRVVAEGDVAIGADGITPSCGICICILPSGVLGDCRLPRRRASELAPKWPARAGRCGSAKASIS